MNVPVVSRNLKPAPLMKDKDVTVLVRKVNGEADPLLAFTNKSDAEKFADLQDVQNRDFVPGRMNNDGSYRVQFARDNGSFVLLHRGGPKHQGAGLVDPFLDFIRRDLRLWHVSKLRSGELVAELSYRTNHCSVDMLPNPGSDYWLEYELPDFHPKVHCFALDKAAAVKRTEGIFREATNPQQVQGGLLVLNERVHELVVRTWDDLAPEGQRFGGHGLNDLLVKVVDSPFDNLKHSSRSVFWAGEPIAASTVRVHSVLIRTFDGREYFLGETDIPHSGLLRGNAVIFTADTLRMNVRFFTPERLLGEASA